MKTVQTGHQKKPVTSESQGVDGVPMSEWIQWSTPMSIMNMESMYLKFKAPSYEENEWKRWSTWLNYNDLTATSLESWLVREVIPKWL